GAGTVNAAIVATLMLSHFKPAAVFFSGTAWALDPALRQGDVVVATTVAPHDAGVLTPAGMRRSGLRHPVTGERDPVLVPAPMPRVLEGLIVTGDVFVTDPARRDELRSVLGATAVEMEGAAVVQACRQFIGVASQNAAAVVAAIIRGLEREAR